METKALEAECLVNKSPTKEEALRNAILAAEMYMRATKLASREHDRARLREKCKALLSRAEEIKNLEDWPPKPQGISLRVPISERVVSKREELILLEGSKIHGFVFPRWTSDPDESIFEEPEDGMQYTEPIDLKLSDAQKRIFNGWRRAGDLTDDNPRPNSPAIMVPTKRIDLVQDITTDCSVVASLCAATARTMKGHGQLLASVIYPYDKAESNPSVSKSGQYIFRLQFNGCFRKVTIDSRLPTSKTQRSLHVVDRNNPQLMWPALLEKAYLKVRGGYDFPGSNSGTDLWVITGWIPEQVFLQSDDVPIEQLWKRVYRAFRYGDVMVTLGTGRLSSKEEKELGLAGEHDYAILNMKETGSQRLLLIKNPWCDGMVWKGSNFTPLPVEQPAINEIWAQELQDALPESISTSPGAFWMSIESVAQNFESLYLNWNPGLFRYRQDHHCSWTIPKVKSPGSFIHNPQYSLKSSSGGTVWVVLSRHFITGEQDISTSLSETQSKASGALGFISIYIFDADGQRVYLSDGALHRGAYVDSPQTLARLEVLPSTSYTVVIAQHGLPLPKYSFTLSFFSRCSLAVEPAVDRLPHCTSHIGAWNSRTAGGNASSPLYPSNPQFSLSVPAITDMVLILEANQEDLAVHVKVVWAKGERVTMVTSKDIVGGSGDYRRGCAIASLAQVPAGKYTIVCSTFEAGQMGNFTLRVCSLVECDVRPVLSENAGRLSLRLPPLIFEESVDRMLAPLMISRLTKLRIVAKCSSIVGLSSAHTSSSFSTLSSSPSRPLLRISLECGQGPHKVVLDVSGNGDFSDVPMGIRSRDLDLSPDMSRRGFWIVVERLGGKHRVDSVVLDLLSDCPVSVGPWDAGDG